VGEKSTVTSDQGRNLEASLSRATQEKSGEKGVTQEELLGNHLEKLAVRVLLCPQLSAKRGKSPSSTRERKKKVGERDTLVTGADMGP